MSQPVQLPSAKAHALWASTYDEMNPVLSLEERTIESLLPVLEGKHVLDVACGTGRWLSRLAVRGPRTAAGLDLCHEMLQQAWVKAELAGRLIQADATEAPVRSGSVDFTICSFGLSHIADIHSVAGELSRIVNDGGDLIVTDFHPSAQARGWKRGFHHSGVHIEIETYPRSVGFIREAFATEGFKTEDCLEAEFGEPEGPIFEKYGKGDLFHQLRGQMAILVLHFRK